MIDHSNIINIDGMKKENFKKAIPFKDKGVKDIFDAYPQDIKGSIMMLRSLIFDIASAHPQIGDLEETLKWGQPSYLTVQSKSGSTIRIDQITSESGRYAMYFHCQTNLIETFRTIFPSQFTYQGNRAIVFDLKDKIPQKELKSCILLALTYHLNKK